MIFIALLDKLSLIGDRHRLYSVEGWQVFTPRHRPSDDLQGHLVFALKYEGVNLLFFKRLFEIIGRDETAALILTRPNGQYLRRIWFLYEWLMGERLEIPDLKDGNYVPLIDGTLQYVLDTSVNVPRQRIRNNLPGTIDFCPLIFKTEKVKAYIKEELEQWTHSILESVHKDILLRTSAFLLLKDSKASFSIEGESPTQMRTMHWGKAIGQAGSKNLTQDEFLRLQ